jgi:hypothetical protein
MYHPVELHFLVFTVSFMYSCLIFLSLKVKTYSFVQEMNEIEEREKADRKKMKGGKDKKRKADEETEQTKKKAKA